MIAQDFKTIRDTLTECFRESGVFAPLDSTGTYFQADSIRKDEKLWLAIAAGVDDSEARDLFRGHSTRIQRAQLPLRVRQISEISLLFVVRPFEGGLGNVSPLSLVVPFTPRLGIECLEVRQAYFRLWDLPENKHGLRNLRWEWDAVQAKEPSLEKWLHRWQKDIGFNPAHTPSHLHLNTDRVKPGDHSREQPGEKFDELRIALGSPNPLAFILGIAAWLRAVSS